MPEKSDVLHIVVLKSIRLYGEFIARQVKELWRNSEVLVFQKGFDALESIQVRTPDLLITGLNLEDMDGVEHLEPFSERDLPVLIVTSRATPHTFNLLRNVRFDGIYDGVAEGLTNLRTAISDVAARRLYVSPSFVTHLKKPKNITLDALTEKEQLVLSVIGDGCDDYEAADRLRLSRFTINTHRKVIMGKLGFHHKGQIMCYALQQGYVHITPTGIYYPGFQRRLRELTVPKSDPAKECA
ncbi:MAG: LuxR C-terminal-related transcriptional regulator [Nibricoccus sp.]